MADLETLNSKLDELLRRVPEGRLPSISHYAYENPPITVEQATIDGKTFNRDGSVWTYDETGRFGGQAGVKFPVCTSYGYFSKEKDPELHAKLLELFGQYYLDWYEARDPWAIYKASVREMAFNGTLNWINFSWLMQPYTRFVQ